MFTEKINVTFRDFIDADYDDLVRIHNTIWTDTPTTVMERRNWVERHSKKHLYRVWMVDAGQETVGYLIISENEWSHTPGKYDIRVMVQPDYQRRGIGTQAYDYALKFLETCDPAPVKLTAHSRDDQSGALAMLDKLGYEFKMRYQVSRLDVTAFDDTPYLDTIRRVEESGIRLTTLQALMEMDTDWLPKLYEADEEITRDVPDPDGIKFPSMEDYYNKFFKGNINFIPEGWHIALDGEQYIGMSCLWKDYALADRLYTGLTGVRRSHRRRGIATALKVKAIQYARRYGATSIQTDNEENNPMYQLNVQLGFKPVPSWVEYHKVLTDE